eukprot:6032559-Karenia_brevis.AAC.1
MTAALRYNDARYGLGRCPVLAFHPGSTSAAPDVTGKALLKAKAQHLADHTLEQVAIAYQAFVN